ncbi:SoxR reducing system RseC family protein [Parabacteroides gordonii]|nr:SoxR reducing system RseC family protein [Parabacteroides gordonii]MCA5584089.1 SoxR reducing system RseC family protein [Parabacteroides gordonii]RGP11625.1 Fis family transcriptional regulator [Parabacteroides gordonii]
MSESINHNGRIEKIEGNAIFVRIIQQSACSGCHAQGMCGASEKKEKIIEVNDNSGKYHVNEEVTLCGQSSLGLQAVLLAFVLPVIFVVAAIVAGNYLQWDETTSGLTGLLLLVPYYCILYFLREKLKRKFIFTLKKLN